MQRKIEGNFYEFRSLNSTDKRNPHEATVMPHCFSFYAAALTLYYSLNWNPYLYLAIAFKIKESYFQYANATEGAISSGTPSPHHNPTKK